MLLRHSNSNLSFLPSKRALEKQGPILVYSLVTIWLLAWFFYGYGYWEDDAFIHLEFARSLFDGKGFSFNGVVTNGDTSPMWVFLLAGVHYLVPTWILTGKLLMLVTCGAALWAVHLVATKLAPKGIAPQLFGAILVLLSAVNPYFVVWFLAGMETLLAVAVSLLIIWTATIAPLSWRSFLLGSVLAGFAPLLRPELVFLDLIVAPFLVARVLRLSAEKSITTRLVLMISAGVIVIGPIVIWTAYAHEVFGTVIANTNAAKRDTSNDSVIYRLASVLSFGFPLIVVFFVSLPAYLIAARYFSRAAFDRVIQRLRQMPAVFWVTTAWSLFTCAFYVGNRTYIQTRYVLIFALPLTLSILIFIFSFQKQWLSWAISVLVGLLAIATSLAIVQPLIANKLEYVSQMEALAQFIKATLPAEKPIAAFAIGQLAFQTCHPIIDMGGILDPAVVPFVNSLDQRVEWAKQQGAAYLEGGTDERPGANSVMIYESDAHFDGWTLHRNKFRDPLPIRLWRLGPPIGSARPRAQLPSSVDCR